MSIDFENQLNPAQLEAVHTLDGPVLVLAGAGSGKTRTIVFRLAYLMERGIPAHSILLLTFTRKAAQEMLNRAGMLMGMERVGAQGGTFHSFAHSILRRHPGPGHDKDFTVMDRSDQEALLKDIKARHSVGKGQKSYPRIGTILESISKSRNKEIELRDMLAKESYHLLPHADDFELIRDEYAKDKQRFNLVDYDDLLFHLESLMRKNPELLARFREQYRYIMVDEYQDTNLVQARLVELLAGQGGNVMAVGDDAQSIYAFRGANVINILSFPQVFPGCKLIKLEQNYRSTQPILELTNRILAQGDMRFEKELFSERTLGSKPELIRPLSDLTQAQRVVDKVVDLLKHVDANEIAILFRAGYHSYHVEVGLNKLGIKFQKYGGLRYSEAAHIKDVLAYLRIVRNPSDLTAWQRVLGHIRGVGAKTAAKIHTAVITGDTGAMAKFRKKWPVLDETIETLDALRQRDLSPPPLLEQVIELYEPILLEAYPDDYPRRQAGLEQLQQIAASYTDIDVFLSDLVLEDPTPGDRRAARDQDAVVLSTIHSAKGLEWRAVLLIDLVEERFPSRHALAKAEDFEEERRLMYVACTRAKDFLYLFSPTSLYRRGTQMSEAAIPSPFIREITSRYYKEWLENYSGRLVQSPDRDGGYDVSPMLAADSDVSDDSDDSEDGPPEIKPKADPKALPFCTHKIFGRGKIIASLPPDKYRVNFPGFGPKVILAEYLELEDE